MNKTKNQANEYDKLAKKEKIVKAAAGSASAAVVVGAAAVVAETILDATDEDLVEAVPVSEAEPAEVASVAEASAPEMVTPVTSAVETEPEPQSEPVETSQQGQMEEANDIRTEEEGVGEEVLPTSPIQDDQPDFASIDDAIEIQETVSEEYGNVADIPEVQLANNDAVMDDAEDMAPTAEENISVSESDTETVSVSDADYLLTEQADDTPIEVQEIDTRLEMPSVETDLSQLASAVSDLVVQPVVSAVEQLVHGENEPVLAMDLSDDEDKDTFGSYRYDNVGTMQDEQGNDMAYANYHTELGFEGRLVDTTGNGEFDKIMDASGSVVLADAPDGLTVPDAMIHVLGSEQSYLNVDVDMAQSDDYMMNVTDTGINV